MKIVDYCHVYLYFFFLTAMTARLMLAAIEWNNTARSQATDAEGKPCAYVVYSKRRKAFVLRAKYKNIASTRISDMMQRVLQVHKDKEEISPFKRPADLPRNVAPIQKPSKDELL